MAGLESQFGCYSCDIVSLTYSFKCEKKKIFYQKNFSGHGQPVVDHRLQA